MYTFAATKRRYLQEIDSLTISLFFAKDTEVLFSQMSGIFFSRFSIFRKLCQTQDFFCAIFLANVTKLGWSVNHTILPMNHKTQPDQGIIKGSNYISSLVTGKGQTKVTLT